jgi:hypothetical protein
VEQCRAVFGWSKYLVVEVKVHHHLADVSIGKLSKTRIVVTGFFGL